MSADNGVYVLPIKTRYGKVWCVDHRQAIENLNYEPDRKDGYNTNAVLAFVVDATKFEDRASALLAAHDVYSSLDICEYGVIELPEVVLED